MAAPVLACLAGLVAGLRDRTSGPPELCAEALGDNMCEETTLGVIGGHVIAFVALWMLLWLIPWWRGLRVPRIVVAVAATIVLMILPVRLAA